MNISKKGMGLIEHFEGLYLKAYLCSAKVPTIGIGTTVYPGGSKVRLGDTCSKEDAYRYLDNDMNYFEKAVARRLKVEVTQEQFDALVSIYYNCGNGSLNKSTLMKKLDLKDFEGVALEFPKWCKAAGKKLKGLYRRRVSERDLFLGLDNYIHLTCPKSFYSTNSRKKKKVAKKNSIKYFKHSEFPYTPNQEFLIKLDKAREIAKVPFKIEKSNFIGDKEKIKNGLGCVIIGNSIPIRKKIVNALFQVGFVNVISKENKVYVGV